MLVVFALQHRHVCGGLLVLGDRLHDRRRLAERVQRHLAVRDAVGVVLAEASWPAGYRHGETLLPAIDAMLAELGIGRSRVNRMLQSLEVP